jgi:hypothetical protein
MLHAARRILHASRRISPVAFRVACAPTRSVLCSNVLPCFVLLDVQGEKAVTYVYLMDGEDVKVTDRPAVTHPRAPQRAFSPREYLSARHSALLCCQCGALESAEIPLASFGATSAPEGGSRLMAAAL